ncbi:MAG: hypothetical protein H0W64_10950 [Gammaproteobacteria bacterium]|nr:hypothetical protein [Gammaproteobacteria bacterium]
MKLRLLVLEATDQVQGCANAIKTKFGLSEEDTSIVFAQESENCFKEIIMRAS